MSDQKVIVAKDDPHIKRSRQYLYYLRRVLNGKCGVGGCDFPIKTSQYCELHRVKDLVRRKAKRACRKNGTAPECP